jgi:hypothetical protein
MKPQRNFTNRFRRQCTPGHSICVASGRRFQVVYTYIRVKRDVKGEIEEDLGWHRGGVPCLECNRKVLEGFSLDLDANEFQEYTNAHTDTHINGFCKFCKFVCHLYAHAYFGTLGSSHHLCTPQITETVGKIMFVCLRNGAQNFPSLFLF